MGRVSGATPPVVVELLARSNRLGADPRNTNYAGADTLVKGAARDPVTGDEFSPTTGLLVPVDAGVAGAFLR